MASNRRARPHKLPRGQQLLELPQYNKGTAFSWEERLSHGLLGLLPSRIETLEEQVARAYSAYEAKDSDLERHIYLRQLQDFNETLFYRLIMDYPAELIPIIYTPTVGEACQKFSEIYRKPRGLFVSYCEVDHIDAVLDNATLDHVEVIVMTDSEAILGIGDQGVGGMGIPIGKLALYTALGGVDPRVCLPLLIDVGTDNQVLLDDPLYVGWPHPRISGKEYDDFIDRLIHGIKREFPGVLLQFEDFAGRNASALLARYRDQLCCFNDDVQGTAAVTMGTVLAGVGATGRPLAEHVFTIVGAGAAGCGIAEQLVRGLVAEGLSEAKARERFSLVDRDGLVRKGLKSLTPSQKPFAHGKKRLEGWEGDFGLTSVVANVKPSVLIGVSGQPGLFKEEAVKTMADTNERPIIFPLSNPTSRAEASPADVLRWSEGRALVATGSPFPPVIYEGQTHHIAQCNNAYAFPGIGLGVIAVKARRVSDEMFMATARVIAEVAPDAAIPGAPLLPPMTDIRALSVRIAIAVGKVAVDQGLTECRSHDEVEALVEKKIWSPSYD